MKSIYMLQYLEIIFNAFPRGYDLHSMEFFAPLYEYINRNAEEAPPSCRNLSKFRRSRLPMLCCLVLCDRKNGPVLNRADHRPQYSSIFSAVVFQKGQAYGAGERCELFVFLQRLREDGALTLAVSC